MHQKRATLVQRSPLGVISIVIDAVFLGIAAIALAIRLGSRKLQGSRLCFNDYAALLTWVFLLVYFVIVTDSPKPFAAGELVCAILCRFDVPKLSRCLIAFSCCCGRRWAAYDECRSHRAEDCTQGM